jgi:hypothetical protein
LRYDGGNWSPMESGTNYTLTGAWGTSGTDVFVVGSSPVGGNGHPAEILHYDGVSWSSMPNVPNPDPPIQTLLSSIWGTTSSNLYAAGTLGYEEDLILHYNGASWTVGWLGFVQPTAFLRSAWGPSASEVFAVGYWASVFTNPPTGGQILHYSGGQWSPVMSAEAQGYLYGVWGTSPSDVFAVGSFLGVDAYAPYGDVIQHFDGSSWSVMLNSGGTALGLLGVWGSSPTDVFAVGDRILHYDGSTWTPMNYEGEFSGVWGRSSQDVIVVGSEDNVGGEIIHYDGSSWSPLISGYPQGLVAIWGPAPGAMVSR